MRTNRNLFWLSFFVAAIAVLFGWSAAENAGDLRICRLSVDAINDADARVRIQRVSTSSFSRTIRIDYDITNPSGRVTVNRFAVCKFSPTPTPPFKTELSSFETEAGPLPDTNLYMLKRFYLDSGEIRNGSTAGFPSGLAGFAAHLLEWLLGIAPKAALYAILASIFTLCLGLLRRMPANAFYAITIAITAAFWALVTSGRQSLLSVAMALMTGISCGGCTLLLYIESRPQKEKTASLLLPWGLFAALVMMALFRYPEYGMFGLHWLPPWLFRPVEIAAIAGYAISAPPVALILILLAAVSVFAFPRMLDTPPGPPYAARTHTFVGLASLILCAVVAGVVSAIGYLQLGLVANPLLICTKAVLITLIANAMNRPARYILILLIGLALTSFESALSLFIREMPVNATSYGLLGLALLLACKRTHPRPSRQWPGNPDHPAPRYTSWRS